MELLKNDDNTVENCQISSDKKQDVKTKYPILPKQRQETLLLPHNITNKLYQTCGHKYLRALRLFRK